MRNRGRIYWGWADRNLHCRQYEERLDDGTLIDVKVRHSKAGLVQMFWGVYRLDGLLLREMAFDDMPNETLSSALAGGVEQARHYCFTPHH